jgi:hypothetical protein
MPSYDSDYNYGWDDFDDTPIMEGDWLDDFEGNPDGDDFDDVLDSFGF